MKKPTFSFELPVVVMRQAGSFVAYTPALDISTCARTEKAVRRRFVELVELFLEEVSKAGTLEEVLSELGWTKVRRSWTPPKVVSSRSVGFKLPAFV